MLPTYRLGRVLGFGIDVSVSFLVLLGLVLFVTGGLGGVAIALLAFGSVLLHELGHALVARQLDVRVDSIELNFFGGAARMAQAPRGPRDEILIAAAGPAVSFALAGVAVLLHGLTGVGLFGTLGWINALIGGFNLLPALPMDGGRILRAALARRMPLHRATRAAVRAGRVVALGLGVVAIFQGSLYVVAIAVVIWMLGSRELAMLALGHRPYRDHPEVEVLDADPVRRGHPRGFAPAPSTRRDGRPASGSTPARQGFTVRWHGGRLVVEPAD